MLTSREIGRITGVGALARRARASSLALLRDAPREDGGAAHPELGRLCRHDARRRSRTNTSSRPTRGGRVLRRVALLIFLLYAAASVM